MNFIPLPAALEDVSFIVGQPIRVVLVKIPFNGSEFITSMLLKIRKDTST
jgi:hypothetical protein